MTSDAEFCQDESGPQTSRDGASGEKKSLLVRM